MASPTHDPGIPRHGASPGANPNGFSAAGPARLPQPRWDWSVRDADSKAITPPRPPWAAGRNPCGIVEAVRFESSADRRDDPGAGPEETIPEDEYAVYEAVLTQKFGLGPGSFVVMNEILVAREVAWIREEMKRPRVADQGDLFCTLSESCLADFLKKGEWPFKLGRCFQPTFAYHLMTEAESKEIWEPPPGQLEFHDGWAAFHQRHAGAAWVSLSRAGFDEHHAQALMEAGLLVDGEAGEGGLILLARLDGEWKITGELVSWIA